MKSLIEFVNEALVKNHSSKTDIQSVEEFSLYYDANKTCKANIIKSGENYVVKASNNSKPNAYWLISHFDIEKWAKTEIENEWLIYRIYDKKDNTNRISGVSKSVLVFYAGENGELFASDKEARKALKEAKSNYKIATGGGYKVCQVKDIPQLCDEQKKNYSWEITGLRFIAEQF